MGLFKRNRKLSELEPKLSVQITHDGLSVENASEALVVGLVQFWTEEFGAQTDPKKSPIGFSMDHMSELESDTMRIGPGREPDDDDDDEDDD